MTKILFWLDPVRIHTGGGFNRAQINKIQKIIEENCEKLVEVWNKYFGRYPTDPKCTGCKSDKRYLKCRPWGWTDHFSPIGMVPKARSRYNGRTQQFEIVWGRRGNPLGKP